MTFMSTTIAAILVGTLVPVGFAADEAGTSASAEREFRAQDANGDGKLSPKESADGAKRMFRTMDDNRDGKVTAAEMDAAQEKISGGRAGAGELSSEEKIKIVDADDDGNLTAKEHAQGARELFVLMDLDTDGFLTRDELILGHQEMLQKDARR
jgi:Ca2+-binding EF-hand superfamily protein